MDGRMDVCLKMVLGYGVVVWLKELKLQNRRCGKSRALDDECSMMIRLRTHPTLAAPDPFRNNSDFPGNCKNYDISTRVPSILL